MSQTRVFIGGLPRLLLDILSDIVGAQADMKVVGCGNHRELRNALENAVVDVVIVGAEEDTADGALTARHLLAAYPDLKVVTICDNGRTGHLFTLHSAAILEPSPRTLIEAIRLACP